MYDKNKGFEYERIAVRYLHDCGYKVLKMNFSCRMGEIDIVAEKNGRIHFIEVKGRQDTAHGYPREAVTFHKQKRIITAARYYLMLLGQDDIPCQFDVIEIIADSRQVNHLENAFDASLK